MASSSISGFSSASLRGVAPLPPTGLTFANTGGTPFGGGFGSATCMPNYWTSLGAATATAIGGGSPNVNLNRASARLSHSPPGCPGGFTVANSSAPGCVTLVNAPNLGTRLTLFISDDVRIKNNIVYPAVWPTLADIPYLTVVVCGNIYIDKSVAEIDGWFIAVPRSYCGGGAATSGGTIYTCTNDFDFVPPANMYTDCDTQLTIRGSLTAARIKFLRTHGSLYLSVPGEPNTSPNMAEKFMYGAESWMVTPQQDSTTPVTGGTKFESITGLPPIL
jgi:hypothetical protein